MKIAYLAPAPGIPLQGPTGASAHIRDVCFALRERGVDLRVYAVQRADHRGNYGPPLSATCTGLAPWPSWMSRYRALREVFSARRLSKRLLSDIKDGWKPDLIWERHTLFSDAGLRVYQQTGIPWILEVNSPPTLERIRYESLPLAAWSRRWEKKVLRAAPHVFAVSSWLKNWLLREIGCKQATHIPNGCSNIEGDPVKGRASLGVDESKKILGFVGADKPWQDWRSLIPIAESLGMQLVLLGPFKNVAGAICKSIYDPQRLADVVSSFDVAAAPFKADAPPWFSPLKIALYRGQSVPVAASDIGDCRLAIGAGGGFLTHPGADLGASISRCLSLPRRPFRRDWQVVIDAVFNCAGVTFNKNT